MATAGCRTGRARLHEDERAHGAGEAGRVHGAGGERAGGGVHGLHAPRSRAELGRLRRAPARARRGLVGRRAATVPARGAGGATRMRPLLFSPPPLLFSLPCPLL
jgi:hypothetical protein